MKNITATLVFTSVLAFSPSLYAGSCGGGDHTHSAQEKAMIIFNKADNNSDGFINAGEFNTANCPNTGQHLQIWISTKTNKYQKRNIWRYLTDTTPKNLPAPSS